jgi:integrase
VDSQINVSDAEDESVDLLPPSRAVVPAPIDGTLASERDAADSYRRMAKSENTRRAYRAAVRAWCAWCARYDLPPLPASGQDVAAFLAGERGRKLSPETIKLRRAATRYLHRAAGCPVPTDDVCVSETLAGIRREAAKKGQVPRKKVAATVTILRRLLAPIPGDLRGLRDRAILLVGFAGALRRSELAAIRFEQLERTDRGFRLTLPQTKGEQTDAVTVPLPYGDIHRASHSSRRLAVAESPAGRCPRPDAPCLGLPVLSGSPPDRRSAARDCRRRDRGCARPSGRPWCARRSERARVGRRRPEPAGRTCLAAWWCRWARAGCGMGAVGFELLDDGQQVAHRTASRSRRTMSRVSPDRMSRNSRASTGRLRSAPEACSSNTVSQPAARSSSSCGTVPWSSVETLA